MMNINKTLRLSRNTALLLAAASGLTYMSSCSSDVDSPNGQKPETSSVTVGNNPSSQASRITFYGNPGTRAAADFPEVGEVVSLPADLPEYNDPNAAQQDHQNENRKKDMSSKVETTRSSSSTVPPYISQAMSAPTTSMEQVQSM